MEKIWIITIAITIFLIINFLYYKSLNGYVKKQFGEKMWKTWTSKLYFWQSSLYTSAAITVLIIFLLKWVNILNF
ncbi:hypothetical protein ES674_09535 [Bizionia myxarmorum]|uniref:Immunity protein n=1 Tax=Bizionia myxarmorum TaxID=291186 RepID=A0A5D0R7M7_9FLAO|nr:hypothetical protein ES674_09535 [Bizionia myxarmorum]